jgi:hypothetical protein
MGRYQAARGGAETAVGFDGAVVDEAAKMSREQVHPHEMAARARPCRFVRLSAVQQVEFAESFIDGSAYGQVEQRTADAVRLKSPIVSMLVEIEPALETETIHHCGYLAVEAKRVKPKQLRGRQAIGGVEMERSERARVKGSASPAESRLVEFEEAPERLFADISIGDALESRGKRAIEQAQTSSGGCTV